MTHVNRSGLFSFFLVPLSVALILFGIFSIVWLRSSVRTAEYSIAALDHRRMEILRDRKTLMAEKAGLLSIQSVKSKGSGKLALVFPDRIKVVYVKKDGKNTPFKASLEGRQLSGP
ncbi:MAG: hypothetical protein A3J81_04900 [Nitrospirae bacterium RIFOXYB2_FULL_43_5]|jgi:hypothetical protein|nr:MAG: hypothetical protein A2X54_06230 [Nitrospirae bacterium GWF2_44_13]OGW64924.1 MAG: hypothetical protein A2222_04735 [Nitrospirae bacterium RIFOXYA2_FULL_44_9]OGW70562.1 MAG: hypothetical protein A2484_05165 [Nitrospirae bacterium RIFOXYC2_FULL_44_7]OGW77567.1 MAG: hypothetical protein A3J81_04900 [Nitrospirae bacterium RIFOXYB2_FULL_43_5]HBG92810.1 hypothetical protein [Nitrospiraceae bacterium]